MPEPFPPLLVGGVTYRPAWGWVAVRDSDGELCLWDFTAQAWKKLGDLGGGAPAGVVPMGGQVLWPIALGAPPAGWAYAATAPPAQYGGAQRWIERA